MSEHFEVDNIAERGLEARRQAAAARLGHLANYEDSARTSTEFHEVRNEEREALAEEVRTAGQAVAARLIEEGVPFTGVETIYTRCTEMETVEKKRFLRKPTTEEKEKVEHKVVEAAKFWYLYKKEPIEPTDYEKKHPQPFKEGDPNHFVRYTLPPKSGLCLTEDGELMRYRHGVEVNKWTKVTELAHAEAIDLIPLNPLDQRPIDRSAVVAEWQERFQQLFID